MGMVSCTEKELNPKLGNVLSAVGCGVFIINLDRRNDRWDQITKHLYELSLLSFQRVSAVDGLTESKKLAKRVLRQENENSPSDVPTRRQRGVLGCLKSHLKALKLASKFFDEINMALILEDDCFFIEGASRVLEKSLDELPSKWQFLMLGAVYGSAPGFIPNRNYLMRVYNATAAHAYMVNKESCQLLIQRIEALLDSKTILPIDECFIEYQPLENWYATHPLIAGQRSDNFSDIDGIVRFHTDACFKLGVTINRKIWLWMKIRPLLPIEILGIVAKSISSIWRWTFGEGLR
ncbi:MAG: glycosyltransferase family 25 protein [Parachlamydiales bacterium]|jgi:GR25 family glycosyltransferase involved in LPS biosynthesis